MIESNKILSSNGCICNVKVNNLFSRTVTKKKVCNLESLFNNSINFDTFKIASIDILWSRLVYDINLKKLFTVSNTLMLYKENNIIKTKSLFSFNNDFATNKISEADYCSFYFDGNDLVLDVRAKAFYGLFTLTELTGGIIQRENVSF